MPKSSLLGAGDFVDRGGKSSSLFSPLLIMVSSSLLESFDFPGVCEEGLAAAELNVVLDSALLDIQYYCLEGTIRATNLW